MCCFLFIVRERNFYLLLLFSCPPARAVLPNYEVGVFQLQSGTAPSLGSVDNVISYLSPYNCFNCFMDHSLSPSVYQLPYHPQPLDWAATLFAPNFPLSFRSWNACLNKRQFLPASNACPALAFLPSSTCSPVPCCPHIWVFSVLRYPSNVVIYHYPLFWVILMVILLIFIIQNYLNFFPKYYPKFTIRVIYPFLYDLGEF